MAKIDPDDCSTRLAGLAAEIFSGLCTRSLSRVYVSGVGWRNGVDKGSEDPGGWRHLIIFAGVIVPRRESSSGYAGCAAFVYASEFQPSVARTAATLPPVPRLARCILHEGGDRTLARSRALLQSLARLDRERERYFVKCCLKGPCGFADGARCRPIGAWKMG